MKHLRNISIVLIGTLLASSLGACSLGGKESESVVTETPTETVAPTPTPTSTPTPTPIPDYSGSYNYTESIGSGPNVIKVWSSNQELSQLLNVYASINPSFAEEYTIKCTLIYTDGGEYKKELAAALKAGGEDAPDIYAVDMDMLYNYSKGDMSKYAATYTSLGLNAESRAKEAQIAQYMIDVGSKDGEIVALGFQSTAGVMIYNSVIAKDAFGTDDPKEIEAIVGGGSGNWDKFMEAAYTLKDKGYAIVSSNKELSFVCETSGSEGWVKDGKLTVPAEKEVYLDIAKKFKTDKLTKNTTMYSSSWYEVLQSSGKDQAFCYFGPEWFLLYSMGGNIGVKEGDGTFGEWRVCAPPVGFYQGGTYFFANKDTAQQKGVAKILDWLTLDTSDTGAQYIIANDYVGSGSKHIVASNAVMARTTAELEVLGGQNMFEAFIKANELASGKGFVKNNAAINERFQEAIDKYLKGTNKKKSLDSFKKNAKKYV